MILGYALYFSGLHRCEGAGPLANVRAKCSRSFPWRKSCLGVAYIAALLTGTVASIVAVLVSKAAAFLSVYVS